MKSQDKLGEIIFTALTITLSKVRAYNYNAN